MPDDDDDGEEAGAGGGDEDGGNPSAASSGAWFASMDSAPAANSDEAASALDVAKRPHSSGSESDGDDAKAEASAKALTESVVAPAAKGKASAKPKPAAKGKAKGKGKSKAAAAPVPAPLEDEYLAVTEDPGQQLIDDSGSKRHAVRRSIYASPTLTFCPVLCCVCCSVVWCGAVQLRRI